MWEYRSVGEGGKGGEGKLLDRHVILFTTWSLLGFLLLFLIHRVHQTE